MRKETAARLWCSALGGIALPVLYFEVVVGVFTLLEYLGVDVSGRTFGLLAMPATWAGEMYAYFFGYQDKPNYNGLRLNVWMAAAIGDFFLYSILTYLFLRSRSESNPRRIPELDPYE